MKNRTWPFKNFRTNIAQKYVQQNDDNFEKKNRFGGNKVLLKLPPMAFIVLQVY